ncbi:AAA family ATPase [Bacteroides faecis]|nr:AAA family ATPase [Bacteroides faecis]MCS3160692.1 AAA family ATPase [Bacteroides faecis]
MDIFLTDSLFSLCSVSVVGIYSVPLPKILGDMENNPELQLAWQFIENTGTHLFLTGKAGTGKTTFLKRLREHTPKRMVVLAPTGIAAINAGGVTIHSFFSVVFCAVCAGNDFQFCPDALPFQQRETEYYPQHGSACHR